jgi:hypothetical protein
MSEMRQAQEMFEVGVQEVAEFVVLVLVWVAVLEVGAAEMFGLEQF